MQQPDDGAHRRPSTAGSHPAAAGPTHAFKRPLSAGTLTGATGTLFGTAPPSSNATREQRPSSAGGMPSANAPRLSSAGRRPSNAGGAASAGHSISARRSTLLATGGRRMSSMGGGLLSQRRPSSSAGGMNQTLGGASTVRGATKGGGVPAGNSLQNTINLDLLQSMKAVFDRADADGSGELDSDEFVAAFKGILTTAEGNDEAALAKLFMRIDANCDSTVDWDEFCSYLLLENTGSSASMPKEMDCTMEFEQGPQPTLAAEAHHKELMSGLCFVPSNGSGPDRWMTTAADGTVRVWNAKDLSHVRTIRATATMVTCAAFMPTSHKLIVGSFARHLSIFDVDRNYDAAGSIPDMEFAPLCMECWAPAGRKGVELLALGDAGGFVRLYEVRLDASKDKKSSDRFVGTKLWKQPNHKDWVSAIKFLPQLNALMAVSLDKGVSLTDVEGRIATKRMLGHEKGVLCCDWSSKFNMLATGGADRLLMLWNPFSCKPLAQLAGHSAPIQRVVVNEHNHQIISLSSDKVIKVWDLRNQRCIQTLLDREVYKPDNSIGVMAFDAARRQLVTGSTCLRPWALKDSAASQGVGHVHPVSVVLYNSMFTEVVSGDHAGTVCVWHITTGRLRFKFTNTHGGKRITAMCFDTNHRRLITGAEDGSIKMWNFSSGACISTMRTKSSQEVTGLVMATLGPSRNIIATGWDRRVTFYEDSGRRESECVRSMGGPQSDILAAALMPGGSPTLATASYDGEIWVWNIESGALRRKLLPAGHALRAEDERPVERLAFMSGRLRHVLIAVYADRWVRFWDVLTGACLLSRFSGHPAEESVAALCVAPDNSRVVTGDSTGLVKLWDTSSFSGAAVPHSASSSTMPELAAWRAHSAAITALEWVAADSSGHFIVSSCCDCTLALWSAVGAPLGVCGKDSWDLSDPVTWRSSERRPLTERDQDLLNHAATASDAAQEAEAAQAESVAQSEQQQQLEQRQARPLTAPAGTSFRLKSQQTMQRGLVRQRTTVPPRDAAATASTSITGSEPCMLQSQPASISGSGSMLPDGVVARAASGSFATSSSRTSSSGGARQASFGSRIQASDGTHEAGLPSARGGSNTSSAQSLPPDGPAGNYGVQEEASTTAKRSDFFQRSHGRVNFTGIEGVPTTGPNTPSTQQQQPLASLSVRASEDDATDGAGARVQPSRISSASATAASDDSGGDTSSCSGSDHDSDLDVPVTLWLSEFDAARHSKLTGSGALAARMASAGSRMRTDGLNAPMLAGRVAGSVAHLLHIQAPSEVARPKSAAAALGGGRRSERHVHMARGA